MRFKQREWHGQVILACPVAHLPWSKEKENQIHRSLGMFAREPWHRRKLNRFAVRPRCRKLGKYYAGLPRREYMQVTSSAQSGDTQQQGGQGDSQTERCSKRCAWPCTRIGMGPRVPVQVLLSYLLMMATGTGNCPISRLGFEFPRALDISEVLVFKLGFKGLNRRMRLLSSEAYPPKGPMRGCSLITPSGCVALSLRILTWPMEVHTSNDPGGPS
jgi:hypothetical protein